MISIFSMLVILLPVFSGFGSFFSSFLGNFSEGIAAKLIMGIFTVSVSFTVLAFFCPLSIIVEAITLILGLLLFFYFKNHLQFWLFFKNNKIIFSLLSLVVIVFGSFYPFILDHFGYYVPTVKWIAEVGLVQGISNLDLLLGQMSVWHVLEAGFSNFSDPFLRLNVLVIIVYIIYIVEKKQWIPLLFLPILFLFSQSPSPDLPSIVFSLIILNEIIKLNKNAAVLFALSMFVFALKPTLIWLPLFTFFYSSFVLKVHLKYVVMGTFILFLFLFKNIWTFGYPVFPVQFVDFGFSWKPNAQMLHNSAEIAIRKTYDMKYEYATIQKFTFFEYIKNWFLIEGIKSKIHVLLIGILVSFFVFSLKKKSKIIWFLFISILIKSILILLFSAQYRFFLEVFFVVFLVLFNEVFSKRHCLVFFAGFSLILGIFLSFPSVITQIIPSFKLGKFITGYNVDQFYKPSSFALHQYKTHQIGNLKFNVVKNYPFSFDTPIPAISPSFIKDDLDAGIFPQLKGKTLKDGFIWKKISPREKEELKTIIKDF